jgi:hypothetical protein
MSHDDCRKRRPMLDDESSTLVIERAPLDTAKALLLRGYLTVIRGADHDLGTFVVIDTNGMHDANIHGVRG